MWQCPFGCRCKAYVDGNSQRTKDITFNADALQTITMKLPAGVQLHNLTTGKTSKAGEVWKFVVVQSFICLHH